MNVNIYNIKDYKNFITLAGYKNKPNSNPIKANFRRNECKLLCCRVLSQSRINLDRLLARLLPFYHNLLYLRHLQQPFFLAVLNCKYICYKDLCRQTESKVQKSSLVPLNEHIDIIYERFSSSDFVIIFNLELEGIYLFASIDDACNIPGVNSLMVFFFMHRSI